MRFTKDLQLVKNDIFFPIILYYAFCQLTILLFYLNFSLTRSLLILSFNGRAQLNNRFDVYLRALLIKKKQNIPNEYSLLQEVNRQ